MDVIPKPSCYDSVPPCLCKSCQRYDVYMASCVPRTVGESTCGLAVVNAARYADVYSRTVRRKPARSRPRSRLVAPPVSSSPVAVCLPSVSARSSPVAVSSVSSCAPFGSLARASTASSSSVVSSPVVASSSSSVSTSSSVVVSRPAPSGSVACPVPVPQVRPSPVVVPPISSGPAGSGSTVTPPVRSVPVPPVWPRSVPRTPLTVGPSVFPRGRPVCSPFVPVVCFVLAFVPVLLFSPLGWIWSFLPVWR